MDDESRLRCFCEPGLAVHDGDHCVLSIDGISEFGQVVHIEEKADEPSDEERKVSVTRCATLQDQAKAEETAVMNRMAIKTCREKAEKHGLAMDIVRVRYSFDRTVFKVVFVAEERVDFRELVKDLAGEFHARIIMRQIGVRDEAGLIGGIGPCGRNLCCCTWLRHFESVNVRMAKTQHIPPNPTAISGMCGRLMCCLRFEYDNYVDGHMDSGNVIRRDLEDNG